MWQVVVLGTLYQCVWGCFEMKTFSNHAKVRKCINRVLVLQI